MMTGTRNLVVAQSTQIGALLLERGVISQDQAEQVVRYQREHKLRFGEAALALGMIAPGDLRDVLATQFDYPVLQPGDGLLHDALSTAYFPHSRFAEKLRSLRSQILLQLGRDHGKVVAVLGDRQAGVSHVAANLAVVNAQSGEQTLLVDGNLRAPTLRHWFKLAEHYGLADALANRVPIERVIQRVPASDALSVMPAGSSAPNPQELLVRPAFGQFVGSLRGRYGLTLIDCPNVVDVADAQLIARHCDAVLVVVRKHHSRLNVLMPVIEALRDRGIQLLGVVGNAY
ncbi:MAG TPA: polysaccharide biosynthesis tyrosine autokinase [Chitinolyticbacter sp.]|nr:polysaccharide biosynthesis tyrosine autokinase [Chitinolyticbacter sp.]